MRPPVREPGTAAAIARSYLVDAASVAALAFALTLAAPLPARICIGLCLALALGRCLLRLRTRPPGLLASVARLERVSAQLQHQATHDPLTGLANRVLFSSRLEQAVADGRPFAVCVLDLDRFKVINESLGHGAGDALLKQVASRLLAVMRASDCIARAAGDEFLLLLRDAGGRENIEKLAQRWMNALCESHRIQGTQTHVSPSIGIACYPSDADNGEDLVSRAEEAMCHAKHSGRNMLRFFDAEVMGGSRERATLESELRQAIAAREFRLDFQPRIDIDSGEIRSVEALLRWEHPTRGALLPANFIAVAEDTGLILPIGAWVLNEACRQAKAWKDQCMPYLRVSVNISATQFRQPTFAGLIRESLQRHALHASYLELELSETALMSDAEKSVGILEHISRLGVMVSIDDFGTGFSSLSYLQRFPVENIKIDQSFVRNLETDANDASIVCAIISLAHGLRLKVVAEGVESSGQLAILKRMGCNQYQGFFHSHGVSAAEIESLLSRDRDRAANDSRVRRSIARLQPGPSMR